jgi:outer membrane protein assembly factor BamA
MKILSVLPLCLAATALLFAQTGQQGQDAAPPVVRSITYKGFDPLKIEAIIQRLKDKGVPLGVERRLNSQEVAAAQSALEGLLAENGRPGTKVKADISTIPPRSVSITFTAVTP